MQSKQETMFFIGLQYRNILSYPSIQFQWLIFSS